MKKVLLFGAFFACMGLTGFAQEAAEEVTDEELTKFAHVEVMTSEYVDSKTEELRAMILENEIFQGGARYNEIKAAWGDEAKMTEAEVTEEEKAAYQAVQDFQNSLQDVVKDYKTELIMNDSILGASTYNKVNGAQKSDPAVKEKLDALISELKAKSEGENEDGTEGDGK